MSSIEGSSMVNGFLRIVLKSDLCVASGEGYSSGIDVDVCYDEYGLPIIPARRLKGCLREAAVQIGIDEREIDGLFGVPGAPQVGGLVISNAVLAGLDEGDEPITVPQNGASQSILDAFTYTRAQTALEDGSAKDGSLRFTRVVRHYYPRELSSDEWREVTFRAEVSVDPRFTDIFEDVCKGLRNIGMGRNRGLGAVKCSFDVAEAERHVRKKGHYNEVALQDGGTLFQYAVALESPVMMVQQSGNESLPYIPGSAVYGFFASRLKDDDRFERLFLLGNVRFSPLYPVSAKGVRCVPAFSAILKVKGGQRDGEIVGAEAAATLLADGVAMKPLKEGFVDEFFLPVAVATEVAYHHRTGDDATLYTQKCLSAGQVFSGTVEVASDSDDLVSAIREVLDVGVLSLGRSKTAQYARCSLVEQPSVSPPDDSIDIRAGRSYVLLLESDTALLDSHGQYTTEYGDLEYALRFACGEPAWWSAVDADCSDCPVSSLRYRIVTGYNSKWNQKKPHIRAFAAGSCLVVRADRDASSVRRAFYIGERQSEGFGRISIIPLSSVRPEDAPAQTRVVAEESTSRLTKAIRAREEARSLAVAFARTRKPKFGESASFNPSFIGRLARMAEQSGNRRDLDDRIASIKTKSKRQDAERLIGDLARELGEVDWPLEQECIGVVLELGKYFAKQSEERSDGR